MAVHLGFPTKVPKLCITQIPMGKIGSPALWLGDPVEVVCCDAPSTFICQILAPGDSSESYYRYLYIFQCSCCKLPKALRAQLPQHNALIHDAVEEEKIPEDDWNTDSNPEEILKLLDQKPIHQDLSDIGLEVFEEDRKVTDVISKLFSLNLTNEEAVKDFYEHMEGGVESAGEEKIVDSNEEDEDVGSEELENEGRENRDVAFDTLRWFGAFNVKNPVIRYCKGGQWLWYSDKDRPEVRPGKCVCGRVRVFECQVLPQIIACVENEVEFGGIYVFTCPESCDQGGVVIEEAFYQPSL